MINKFNPRDMILREPTTLAAIAIGISGAGAGASVIQSNRAAKSQKSAAEDQQRKQQAEFDRLQKEQSQRESGLEATRIRDEAVKRQRQQAAGASGRRSTILTSPLGLSGEQTTGKKTLLGA